MPRIRNLGELELFYDDPVGCPDWVSIAVVLDDATLVNLTSSEGKVVFMTPEGIELLKLQSMHEREAITYKDRMVAFYRSTMSEMRASPDGCVRVSSVFRGDLIYIRKSCETFRYTQERCLEDEHLERYLDRRIIKLLHRLDEAIGITFLYCKGNEFRVALAEDLIVRRPSKFVSALARKMTRWWNE